MFKILLIVLLTLSFGWKLFLSISDATSKKPIPENVSDLYSEAEFERWRRYHAEKCRLQIVTQCASYVIDLLLLVFDVYAMVASLFSSNPYVQAIVVVFLSLVGLITDVPFGIVDTMKIEQKYGFNKTTWKTFVFDQIKSFVFLNAILIGLTCLYAFLHQLTGNYIILVFAGVLALLITLILFVAPYLGKISNKFVPLEEGELKEKLTSLLSKYGYRVRGIFVMDASRRTTKSNAYFTGAGKTKTIVLYDNLVTSSTPDEICAVFAHEMGHGLHKDTLKGNLRSIVVVAVLALLLWANVSLSGIYADCGFPSLNYGFAVYVLMQIEFAFLNPLLQLVANALSRKAEYAADRQAVLEGYGDALISALKKLTKENFGELAPSKIIELFEYNHPTLSDRIFAIEAEQNKKDR